MSTGLGYTTILGCLDSGEKLVGLRSEGWMADGGGPDQEYFASVQAGWRSGLKYFADESLRSFATTDHNLLEQKMLEWNMRLDKIPEGGRGAVYMISQYKDFLEWLMKGIRVFRNGVHEFVLTQGVKLLHVGDRNNPLAQVYTRNRDMVFMYRCPEDLGGPLGMLQRIEDLERRMRFSDLDYEGVQPPCVKAEIDAPMGWILGLRNGGFFISYAQQKIEFGMNELGFAVREETGMTMERCIMRPRTPFILSPNGEKFLFWRRRVGVEYPVSMFHFGPEDYKDPGDLNKIIE